MSPTDHQYGDAVTKLTESPLLPYTGSDIVALGLVGAFIILLASLLWAVTRR